MQIKDPAQYTPATLEEAIDYLFECCDAEDKEFILTEGKSQATEMIGADGEPFGTIAGKNANPHHRLSDGRLAKIHGPATLLLEERGDRGREIPGGHADPGHHRH